MCVWRTAHDSQSHTGAAQRVGRVAVAVALNTEPYGLAFDPESQHSGPTAQRVRVSVRVCVCV